MANLFFKYNSFYGYISEVKFFVQSTNAYIEQWPREEHRHSGYNVAIISEKRCRHPSMIEVFNAGYGDVGGVGKKDRPERGSNPRPCAPQLVVLASDDIFFSIPAIPLPRKWLVSRSWMSTAITRSPPILDQ